VVEFHNDYCPADANAKRIVLREQYLTAKQVITRLLAEGWYEVAHSGSHKQFKHNDRPGKVTVPVHGNKDIPKGTLASIFRQAGW
jgi:predicted RNA binding protein YcfA (HicA-like mRNA interferase family)